MSFIILRKAIKLELNFTKFILKPVVATVAMCVCSYFVYTSLLKIILLEKIATVVALIVAVIIYLIMVIILKIFTKEELLMIPYGQKISKILEKLGIYEKTMD